MNMQQQLTSLRELFMLFEDPKDKFVQLMDMAKESGAFMSMVSGEIHRGSLPYSVY